MGWIEAKEGKERKEMEGKGKEADVFCNVIWLNGILDGILDDVTEERERKGRYVGMYSC